jgi:hypothetical protein
MYKQKIDFCYHIFANYFDEYVGGKNGEDKTEEVLAILGNLLEDGQTDIRIYKQEVWDKEEGVFDDGDCIFSLGEFPQ